MISREWIALVTLDNVSTSVHIVLTVTSRTCCNACRCHAQRMTFHRNHVRIETVRALGVVGIEHGRYIQIAIAKPYSIIHSEQNGPAIVYSVEWNIVNLIACIRGKSEIFCTALYHRSHFTEYANTMYCTAKGRRFAMSGSFKHKVAWMSAIFRYYVSARRKHKRHNRGARNCKQSFSHFNNSFSAFSARSKPIASYMLLIYSAMRSLHRLPMLPSCVWWMWWSA